MVSHDFYHRRRKAVVYMSLQDNAMKVLLLLAFVSLAHGGLLGTKKCTYGPSYWCSHVDHARECGAMQHCISTVWNNQLQGKTGATENCFSVIETLDGVRRAGIPHNMLLTMAASCTQMTGGRRTLCKELLIKNKNEVALLLQSDLSSAKVATALGLCGSFPDTVPHPQDESAQVVKQTRDICTDCVNFLEDLQEIVNKSEERIAEKVKDKICVKLGYFENLCNETVDTYTQFVLGFIEQQLNPQDLCFLFRFCGNATHDDFVKAIKAYAASSKDKFHSVECIACQDFAKELQSALRNTALQGEILSLLENDVCSRLPGNFSTECKTYVSEYGPLVFEVLVAELDPATICQSLGFCSATVEQKHKLTVVPLGKPLTEIRLQESPQQSKLGFSPQCFLCEEIIKKLIEMGVTNKTEAEIVAALEEVCSLLPSAEKTECDDLVEKYGTKIAQFLQTMAPEVVCTALHLCVLDQLVEVGPAEPVRASDECQVCEMVVTPIRDYLNNPAHEKTIEQFMDRVCDLVPASDKNTCLEMIDMYESLFLHFLNEYDDPLKVCTTLHLCPAKQVEDNESGHPLTFVPMVKLQPAMPRLP